MERICTFNVAYRGNTRTKFTLVVDGCPMDSQMSCYLKNSPYYMVVEDGRPVIRSESMPEFKYYTNPGDEPSSIILNSKTGLYGIRDYKETCLDTALLSTRKDTELMTDWVGYLTTASSEKVIRDFVKNLRAEVIELANDSYLTKIEGHHSIITFTHYRSPYTKIRERVRAANRILNPEQVG